jgi:transcriptional regulator
MPEAANIQPGTLDMLVLKVLSVQPEHGWGIGQRLQQASRGVFDVNPGSLYPALQRLLARGWIRSQWRMTDSNREARYYELTRSGRARLLRERAGWERQVEAVGRVLRWT